MSDALAWYAVQREVKYIGFNLKRLQYEYPHVLKWQPLYTHPAPQIAHPSAEALVQAALNAAAKYHDEAAKVEHFRKGKSDIDRIQRHIRYAKDIRALDKQQIIESVKS